MQYSWVEEILRDSILMYLRLAGFNMWLLGVGGIVKVEEE